MENSLGILDEAITDGLTYVKTIVGDNNWMATVENNYLENKKDILTNLGSEMATDNTLIKIILSSMPVLCDIAKIACPTMNREHASLALKTVADLLKQPSFNGEIISTYFKILEALALIHDSNLEKLK